MGSRQKPHRLSRAEWRALISEQRESGLSRGTFCTRHGVNPSTFSHWKWRFAREHSNAPQEPTWLELPVPSRSGSDHAWDLELELGNGMVLRIRR